MRAILDPKRLSKYFKAVIVTALVFASITSSAQVYPDPSDSWGIYPRRVVPDLTLYFPTGCGVPTDSTFLFSLGFGHGEIKKLAALYYDSCGGHEYIWDPSRQAWHIADSSSGGGGLDTSAADARYLKRGDSAANNTHGFTTQASRQKLSDSLQAIFNALLALKKNANDSVANSPGSYTTQASRQKLSDSLQGVFNALLALKKNANDSLANSPGGFTTQASRQKLSDSLQSLIKRKVDTGTTFGLHFRRLGQPGDSTIVRGRDSTFLVAAIRDSLNFHHVINPDSSWTFYSTDGGGGTDSGIAVLNGVLASRSAIGPTVFLQADSGAYATRVRVQKGIDSLGRLIGGKTDTAVTDSIKTKINKKASFITGTQSGAVALTYTTPGVNPGDTNYATKAIQLKAASGYPLIDTLQTTDSAAVFNLKDTIPGVYRQLSGLIQVDSTQQIGDIYNKSTWSSLADFTQTGSGASFTASGGKIEVPTSSSAVLALNDATMLDQDGIAMDFVYTNFTGTDYGLTYGWASIGSSGQSQVSVYMYVVGITGSDLGKIDLFQQVNGGSPTQYLSPGHLTSIITGDTITYNLKSNAGTFSGYARNHRTGDTVSISVPGNFLDSGISHNTAQVAILAGNTASGSTEEIQSLRHYSWAPKGAVVVPGVSIDYGDVAGAVANRYITKAHLVTASGVGDISAMGLAHEKEIINFLKPKAVFTEIATNDVGFGISIGTTEANLTAFYDTMIVHGIPAYFLLCPPRNDVNVTTINTWIKTNYPGKYIDLYTPLWAGTGTGMASIYNSGDGVHPDSLGHDVMYRTIIADSLYQKYANDGWLSYYDDPGIPSSTTKDNAIPNIGWVKRYVATAFTGAGGSGDSITGSGTTNKLTKFTGTTVIGNSSITDNGTNISTTETFNAGSIGIGVTPSYPLDFGGYRTAGFQMHYGDLGFQSYNADNNYIFTNSQNVSGTYKYVNTGSASMIQTGSTPGMLFNVAPSGSAGTAITFIPMLQIVPAGRILFNAIGDNGVDQFQFYGTSKFYGLVNYSGNFGSSYTIRSPTDKGYVDSAIAAYVAAHPSGDDSTNMATKYDVDTAKANIRTAIAAAGTAGSYVPTLTGTANVSSTTSDTAIWIRSGNNVSVDGHITITTTATTTSTICLISLPISSLLNGGHACWGGAHSPSFSTAGIGVSSDPWISTNTSNHVAQVQFVSGSSAGAVDLYYHFTYMIQ